MQLIGRRFDTLAPVRVTCTDGQIAAIDELPPEAVRADLPHLAPGLVDIQINGYAGQEFSSPQLSAERVATIVEQVQAGGVTRFCPTLTTQSPDVLRHGMRTVADACEQSPGVAAAVLGIHLEGPYLSRFDGPRGAHPLAHCREPDWDEFAGLQEAAGGRICLLTLSPEYHAAPAFIARAVASGVTVSIGHTAATGDQIRAAVDVGARLSTHLGNGAHGVLRRHPNYIWDQLADDRLSASLIVDGYHLPPEVVRVFVRAKGANRIILVSDLSGLAGLPPGRYASMGGDVEILADGRLVIAGQDQLLAGASRPLHVGVVNVMRYAGVDLAAAVSMASTQPARLLGAPAGGLAAGQPADLVQFRLPASEASAPGLEIVATVVGGQVVAGAGLG